MQTSGDESRGLGGGKVRQPRLRADTLTVLSASRSARSVSLVASSSPGEVSPGAPSAGGGAEGAGRRLGGARVSAVHPGDPAASSPELGAPLGEASGQVCGALRRKLHRGRWLGLSGAGKVGARAGRKGALTSSRQREEAGQGGTSSGRALPSPYRSGAREMGVTRGAAELGEVQENQLAGSVVYRFARVSARVRFNVNSW